MLIYILYLLTILIPLPLTRQATDYTCGAAVTVSILGYYGEIELESDVCNALGTNNDYGTARHNIARFFKEKGYEVNAHDWMSLQELKDHLDKGHPVICLIQAWDEQPDYTHYWGIGHYVVAVGYDADNLYFFDPYLLGNYGYIPTTEFMKRWHQFTHDKQYLVQWGMAVSKEKASFDPKALSYIP